MSTGHKGSFKTALTITLKIRIKNNNYYKVKLKLTSLCLKQATIDEVTT